MTVDPAHENPSTTMLEPLGNLPKGDPAHHTHRSEVMSHIMKSNPGRGSAIFVRPSKGEA
jgi:hypothetical protein